MSSVTMTLLSVYYYYTYLWNKDTKFRERLSHLSKPAVSTWKARIWIQAFYLRAPALNPKLFEVDEALILKELII